MKIFNLFTACNRFKVILPEYIIPDNKLSSEEIKAVEAHLEKCPDCCKELERLRKTVGALTDSAKDIQISPYFADRVIERIRQSVLEPVQTRVGSTSHVWRWASGLAVSAAAILVFFIVFKSTPAIQNDFYKVIEVTGKATITDTSGKSQEITPATTITGGKITLAQNAKITFASPEVLFQLKENSSAEIKKLTKEEKSIFLAQGSVYTRIRKTGLKKLSIKTDKGTAQAVGTAFIVTADQTETKVSVLTGKVLVSNEIKKESLEANQSATVQKKEIILLKPEENAKEVKWIAEDLQEKYNTTLLINQLFSDREIPDIQSLIKKYSDMLKNDPNDLKALLCLSIVHFGDFRPDLAMPGFEKLADKEIKDISNGEKAMVYSLLIGDQYRKNNSIKLKEYTNQLIAYENQTKDENFKKYVKPVLARAYIEEKNITESEKIINYLETLKKDMGLYILKAKLEMLKNDLKKAEEYLDFALNNNLPDRNGVDKVYALAQLGEIAYKLNNLKKSRECLEQAVKANNNFISFNKLLKQRIILSEIYRQQNENEKASATLKEALNIADPWANKFGYYTQERDEIKKKLENLEKKG